ncbi:hypothetical protein [Bifidobacterium scardovii]|uniref:PhnA protein n=1 Tax=Bifidobacterium scardovii TaxID=158787 RepID=A0A087DI50_9BIFI|nr:hypothetical protein [Bifidobacterium scardovii]KFI95200.1 PhnA protein [Bifidobacterium scardovii]MDK6348719.1 hypothetical protein [Bifidobacterium scardovii]MDU8981304.1 hypothetical protein [Bifidobacterium scardovii]BAQ31586.1 hypothetical protein BBSC_1506 [Bifidobacterium scardovii JCM 12489 = DSM 13734]
MNEHNAASFRRDLASIRNGLPALREIAAKRARVTSRQTGHGSRTVAPIPLNLGAWSLLQDILTLVEHMSRVLGLPMRMDAEGQLKGIIPHADKLLERADAPAIMELVSQAERRLDRMLNPPPETKMIGWCPTCGCELRCDPLELQSGYKACDRCAGEYRIKDIHRNSMLKLAIGGAQGTSSGIRALLAPWGIDIKRNTISQWAKRGIIRPVAADEHGDPVYLVWDIWQAHVRKNK